jgi:hypothetical protein
LQRWHTTRNDRKQRELLRSAAASDLPKYIDTNTQEGKERLKRNSENVDWLLAAVDKLADDRNNLVHAPFMFSVADDGTLTMQSFSVTGNERAKELPGLDLLGEMKRHRDNMAAWAHSRSL